MQYQRDISPALSPLDYYNCRGKYPENTFMLVQTIDFSSDLKTGFMLETGKTLGAIFKSVKIGKKLLKPYCFKSVTKNIIIDDISKYKPEKDEIIEMVVRPHGVLSRVWKNIKKIGKKIAPLVVAAIVFVGVMYVGWAVVGLSIGKAAIVGATAAYSVYKKMTADDDDDNSDYDPEYNPGYYIGGVRNRVNPGAPVPIVLGEFRWTPYLGAADFPYVLGEKT